MLTWLAKSTLNFVLFCLFLVVFGALIIVGIGLLLPVSEAPVETVVVTQEVIETVYVTVEPEPRETEPPARTEEPAATEELAATEPAATEEPPSETEEVAICSNYQHVVTYPFGQPEPVKNNMDIGDPSLVTIVQAWDGQDTSTTFHAIVWSGENLDFEKPTIVGTFFQFTGDPEGIKCRAQEMWQETGGFAYRMYVGPGEPPSGWSLEPAPGWTMSTAFEFTEEEIAVPDAEWYRNDIVGTAHGQEGWWHYIQGWDGSNASVLWHAIIEPGWFLQSSSANVKQGADFMTKIPEGSREELLARYNQMTMDEVLHRDEDAQGVPPTISMVYCGEGTPPSGWTNSLPTGWTCQPIDP